jgi:hypothetical protein
MSEVDDEGYVTESVSYVYEYWDCAYCGAVGVRGDEESCVQCGHPRDGDVTFYRKEDFEEVVEDGQHLERFTEGPDWVCAFCETLNRATDGACRSCNATREDSKLNYLEMRAKREAREAERRPAPPPAAQPSSGMGGKLALGCGGLLVVLVVLGWWLTREHDVSYEVAKVHWKRDVVIERYTKAQHTDWSDELKGNDIVQLSSTKEVRRYEKKKVGTESKQVTETKRVKTGTKKECKTEYQSTGSGASKKIKKCKDVPVYENKKVTTTKTVSKYKEFPVYGQKVTYTSSTYGPLKTASAEGADNKPSWPKLDLGTGEGGKPDREGKKTERYTVDLSLKTGEGPKTVKLSTNTKRFEGVYKLGSVHTVKVNNAGVVDTGDKADEVLEKE